MSLFALISLITLGGYVAIMNNPVLPRYTPTTKVIEPDLILRPPAFAPSPYYKIGTKTFPHDDE